MTDPNTPERTHPEEPEMNASSPQQLAAEPYDDYDDGFDEVLPVRSRASYLTPLTALLMALILGGVGFYVGIRVEKSENTTGSAGSGLARAFAGAGGATGAGGAAGAGGPQSSGTSKTGSTSKTAAGSFASRFAAAGFGGAGGTVGSVTSVSGNTLYIKETSGNTVKVKLSSATKISKTQSVSRKKVYPGDELTVAGSAGSNGTVQATSVTDSGASSTGSSSPSSTSSGSANSSSSAIGSLFGGG
jgi:hypothetical protein